MVSAPEVATTVVEPYNNVLCADSLLEQGDVTLVVDSKTLYGIRRCNLDVERTRLIDWNNLLAQVIPSLTVSLRFDRTLDVDVMEFKTNLVLDPRVRFMLGSYPPVI